MTTLGFKSEENVGAGQGISIHFVLDLTSNFRFEMRRKVLRESVILPILQYLKRYSPCDVEASFSYLYGSLSSGLNYHFLAGFQWNSSSEEDSFEELLRRIDKFIARDLETLSCGDGGGEESISGCFGVAGILEAISGALTSCFSQGNNGHQWKHLVLLPTSAGTESPAIVRTCPVEKYSNATPMELVSHLRARGVSLSLVAPGLSESAVVDQFLVFKCNEKIATLSGPFLGQLQSSLGAEWIIRLSASLINEDTSPSASTAAPSNNAEGEVLQLTLQRLSNLPPSERVVALKNLLENPLITSMTAVLRQQLAQALKALEKLLEQQQLQQQQQLRPAPLSQTTPALSTTSILPLNPQSTPALGTRSVNNVTPRKSAPAAQSLPIFWSGFISFMEKQQAFHFRAQFSQVDGQPAIPPASLEAWPNELGLTGLLDSKKDSILAGLTVGYAFKVSIAPNDRPVASYLMGRMAFFGGNAPAGAVSSPASGDHLACFRISQDVLVMLRVLNLDELQLIGYLIDRRHPKATTALPATNSALNNLHAITKPPLSTTLSSGLESLSIGLGHGTGSIAGNKALLPSASLQPKSAPNSRRPSFTAPLPPNTSIYFPTPQQQFTAASQQQQIHHLQQQHKQHLAMPQTLSNPNYSYPSNSALLTDPQAILQMLRPVSNSANLTATHPQAQQLKFEETLDASFVDAWLN